MACLRGMGPEGIATSFLLGGQNVSPLIEKYHSADVSQMYTTLVKTNPPATGTAHPGIPLRVSNSIFATNAP
jgi:hypothetical protein